MTVARPAGWLMRLPWGWANVVCALAYGSGIWMLHSFFSLPDALRIAGNGASGLALAGVLLCGIEVLPGLWLTRLVWELSGSPGPLSGHDWQLALACATGFALQTALARYAVLKMGILPSKLRRLRKTLTIAAIGCLSAAAGTVSIVTLAGSALWNHGEQLLQQALVLWLPEWAGIALLLPLCILWLQDDDWRALRKWRVSGLTMCMVLATLAITARALWTESHRVQTEMHQAHAAWSRHIEDRLQHVAFDVQVLQNYASSTATQTTQVADMATILRSHNAVLQDLRWSAAPYATAPAGAPSARQATLTEALRTGQALASPRLLQAQEGASAWRLMYVAPVVGGDHKPRGVVEATVNPERLVAPHDTGELYPRMHYRLADYSAPPDEQTVYENRASETPPLEPLWRSMRLLNLGVPDAEQLPFSFGGRRYVLESTPSADFWAHELSRTPVQALCLGLLFTWLTLASSLALTGSTQLLTLAVNKRTEQLQLAEKELQTFNERLQQQSTQLLLILEAMDHGYLGFDAEGALAVANETAFMLLDLTDKQDWDSFQAVAEHIGRHYHQAQSQALSLAQSMLNVRSQEDNMVYRDVVPSSPNAPERYLDLRVHTFDAPELRTIILVQDTTPHLQLERSKNQFMSFAAHEIRTPLTVMQGYADLLAARSWSTDKVREMGRLILEKSRGLNALLQRMLDLSELDMNGLDATRTRATDVSALCDAVCAAYTPRAGYAPPVVEHLTAAPLCHIDPVAMEMALTQLLNNAYAFSPTPSPVMVTTEATDEPAGIRITVTDLGMGMDADVAERAFERFYRADSSGKNPGFGLGLSTAKLIADLHHATLTILSAPGQGTSVFLDIPEGGVDARPTGQAKLIAHQPTYFT